jgi:hypothetical protein
MRASRRPVRGDAASRDGGALPRGCGAVVQRGSGPARGRGTAGLVDLVEPGQQVGQLAVGPKTRWVPSTFPTALKIKNVLTCTNTSRTCTGRLYGRRFLLRLEVTR